jgi:hypothetical protein
LSCELAALCLRALFLTCVRVIAATLALTCVSIPSLTLGFIFSIVFSVTDSTCTYIDMIYGTTSSIIVIFMTSFLIDVCDMNDGSF